MKENKPRSEWKNSYARNNPEAYRKYQREYRRKRLATDPEFRLRCSKHSSKFEGNAIPENLTESEFADLLKIPACQICSTPFKTNSEKHVDHCHATGDIRGVLCRGCNWGLGHFRDNIELLEKAQLYLNSTSEKDKYDK